MMDYSEMKARLMATTAALVATGSLICWIHGDTGVRHTLRKCTLSGRFSWEGAVGCCCCYDRTVLCSLGHHSQHGMPSTT